MLENIFETTLDHDLSLHYCGKHIRRCNHSYGPEVRGYHLVVLIKEGTGVLHTKKGDVALSGGDLLVMFPGEKVHYTMDSVCSILWIGVHGPAVEELLQPLQLRRDRPILHLENAVEVERVMDKIYTASYLSSFSDKVMMNGLLYAFFAAILRNIPSEMRFDPVERAAYMLTYNYNLPLTVDLMATTIGCNPSYLSRAFKEKKGQSPKEFLIAVRMDKAAELLAGSALPIGDVSASVGIEDPLYFSRLFHMKKGMTPSQYRAQAKEKK